MGSFANNSSYIYEHCVDQILELAHEYEPQHVVARVYGKDVQHMLTFVSLDLCFRGVRFS